MYLFHVYQVAYLINSTLSPTMLNYPSTAATTDLVFPCELQKNNLPSSHNVSPECVGLE